MNMHRREEKRQRERRAMGAHGDMGFIGEVERNVGAYRNNHEGNAVDRMLCSDVVPSNVETIRYSMRHAAEMRVDRDELPRGRGARQSGPAEKSARYAQGGKVKECRKFAAGGVGKMRKDQY